MGRKLSKMYKASVEMGDYLLAAAISGSTWPSDAAARYQSGVLIKSKNQKNEKTSKKCLTKPASGVNISELSARAVHSGKSSQKSGKTSKTLKKVLDKLSFL